MPPLSNPAKAAIAELEQLPDNEYVIAGQVPGQFLTDLQRPWRRIRKKAGLNDVRIHDLRHTFASIAVGSGLSLPLIGKLLGHTQWQTTARYAHLADEPVREAANDVGDRFAQFFVSTNSAPVIHAPEVTPP